MQIVGVGDSTPIGNQSHGVDICTRITTTIFQTVLNGGLTVAVAPSPQHANMCAATDTTRENTVLDSGSRLLAVAYDAAAVRAICSDGSADGHFFNKVI